MAKQHRATPEQWKEVENHNYLAYSCILELRDRIEALEAAAKPDQPNYREIPDSSPLCVRCWAAAAAAAHMPAKPNHPAKPDSSLMWRITAAIDNGTACDREPERIARDAIRAVTAWMREQRPWGVAFWAQLLEQEAER